MKDKVAREMISRINDEILGILDYSHPKRKLHTTSVREHIEILHAEIGAIRKEIMMITEALGLVRITTKPLPAVEKYVQEKVSKAKTF